MVSSKAKQGTKKDFSYGKNYVTFHTVDQYGTTDIAVAGGKSFILAQLG